MADDLAGLPIGTRIQRIRERTGKTRPVLGGLVGKSEAWLKNIESGRRRPPSTEMLIRLAEVLGLSSLRDLIGDDTELNLDRRPMLNVVPPIREAIEHHILAFRTEPAPDMAALHERVAHAWRTWHASIRPRTDAGTLLPALIRDTRRAARVLDGDPRRQANIALAGVYALCEQVLAWVAEAPLLWLAADRCMDAATQADDPETLAAAAWVLGNVWRSTGREDDAWNLTQDACRLLEPRLEADDPSARALWGSNQLHSAITAARLGREGDALRCLDLAGGMVERLPRAYMHPWTLFGAPNAALTAVSVQVDLRKSRGALDAARQVDPDQLHSIDRRARLWLETARAYAGARDYTGALHVLERATSVSEESMRCHPLARGLASELVTSGGPLVDRESRALASRLGLAV
jgi:transcriptional regulator with XRE-family HTH domain